MCCRLHGRKTGMRLFIAVAALAALAAIRGAELNVRINAAGLADKSAAAPLLTRAAEIVSEATSLQEQVLKAVNDNIDI